MDQILKIAKWQDVFERAESRKLKTLSWVAIPTSFSSNGYQLLLDEFGDEAPAIYGAWCVLVAYAASCTVRGTLATSKGMPVKVGHIARTTGFGSTVFQKLINWAVQDSVAWLIPAQPHEIPKNNEENCNSAESPEASGEIPVHTDRQDRQDKTRHNTTTTDQTGPPGGQSVGQSSVEVVIEKFDLEQAKLLANKLLRYHESALGTETIWQVACVASLFDEAIVTDLVGALKRDSIRSPSKYVRGVIRRACEERGLNHNSLLGSLPSPPAKKSRVSEPA